MIKKEEARWVSASERLENFFHKHLLENTGLVWATLPKKKGGQHEKVTFISKAEAFHPVLVYMKTLVMTVGKPTTFFRHMHTSVLVHLPQAWAISFAKKCSLPYCLLITEVCNKDATSSTSRRFFAEQHTKSGRISRAFLQAFSYPSITCAANNKYSLHHFTMLHTASVSFSKHWQTQKLTTEASNHKQNNIHCSFSYISNWKISS